MPFVFPHFIMAANPHVKCHVGSRWENKLSKTKKKQEGDNKRKGRNLEKVRLVGGVC